MNRGKYWTLAIPLATVALWPTSEFPWPFPSPLAQLRIGAVFGVVFFVVSHLYVKAHKDLPKLEQLVVGFLAILAVINALAGFGGTPILK